MKIEIIEYEDSWEADWPPEDALGALKWLADKIAEIPDEYRSNAKIEFTGIGDYDGDTRAIIRISYERPPTEKEIADDLATAAVRKEMEEKRERRKYEELKARFGDKGGAE